MVAGEIALASPQRESPHPIFIIYANKSIGLNLQTAKKEIISIQRLIKSLESVVFK